MKGLYDVVCTRQMTSVQIYNQCKYHHESSPQQSTSCPSVHRWRCFRDKQNQTYEFIRPQQLILRQCSAPISFQATSCNVLIVTTGAPRGKLTQRKMKPQLQCGVSSFKWKYNYFFINANDKIVVYVVQISVLFLYMHNLCACV